MALLAEENLQSNTKTAFMAKVLGFNTNITVLRSMIFIFLD